MTTPAYYAEVTLSSTEIDDNLLEYAISLIDGIQDQVVPGVDMSINIEFNIKLPRSTEITAEFVDSLFVDDVWSLRTGQQLGRFPAPATLLSALTQAFALVIATAGASAAEVSISSAVGGVFR